MKAHTLTVLLLALLIVVGGVAREWWIGRDVRKEARIAARLRREELR